MDVEWHYHRVAVALGSQRKVPFTFGDFDKGFVHVFDEDSFSIIVQELDTITDFVNYLVAKEHLYESGVETLFQGAEEDLLALYLHKERKFPDGTDMLILDRNLWASLSERDEVKRRREADRDSRVWDMLIEGMCTAVPNLLEAGPLQTKDELVVRTMAREDRFSRRMLGVAYKDFLVAAKQGRTQSRLVPALSDVAYVFVHGPFDDDLKYEEAKLYCRCFIARGLKSNCKTVIGISTADRKSNAGWCSQLCYLHMPEWTQENQTNMEKVREDTGFFRTPDYKRVRGDEFPQRDADNVRIEPLSQNAPCFCGSGKRFRYCCGKR